ncbi:MAG: putative protein N(5)-glutamine methyltransferase [Sciscionella sp.]|nr:putative protein N(5)-glutamine methyltransferase [Sciscionella sp.]
MTAVASTVAAVAARLRATGCVFADDEARLLVDAAGSADELTIMTGRRVDGEPLEHILGWAEFLGRRIAVEPGVFVPRKRTEFLAVQALSLTRPGTIAVELCCGAAAIGVVLAAGVDGVRLHAVDIDPVAVRCARRNLAPVNGKVYVGDLYRPLPVELRGRVEVLVANAPYVPTESIALLPPEAREHEPKVALDGGADGLDVLRRIVAGAQTWLAPAGHLLVETSERQAARLLAVFGDAGLIARTAHSPEAGATVVLGSPSKAS